MKNLCYLFAISHLCILFAGCGGMNIRAHGGRIGAQPGHYETVQPENPKDAATQDTETTDDLSFAVPPGAFTEFSLLSKDASGKTQTNHFAVRLPTNAEPMQVKQSHVEKSAAKVGASQLDTIGLSVAKLKSTKWWSVFGFMVFIGGIVAALYPPVQTLLGGPLPGLGVAAAGLCIAVLPVLMVGHETFIIIGAAVALGIALVIWFAHTHGGLMAEISKLKQSTSKEITL